jgi:preprotein translocase subunit SecE
MSLDRKKKELHKSLKEKAERYKNEEERARFYALVLEELKKVIT